MVSVELSDDGFDTPYAGSGTLFLLDLKALEFLSVLDVGPAAHLCGDVADLVDLDDLAVFGGEDSLDALLLGLLVGHLDTLHWDLGLDALVDPILDLLELFRSYLPVEVEVESEPLGGDVGSLLVDVRRYELPECCVEEVSGGVQLGGLLAVVRETSLECSSVSL